MKKFLPIFFILTIFGLSCFLSVEQISRVPLCYFKYVTGFDCPGCGLTRAFIYLFHGQFRLSIAMNALAPVIAVLLFIYFLQHLYFLIFRTWPDWVKSGQNRLILKSFAVLFFGQWLLKIYSSL